MASASIFSLSGLSMSLQIERERDFALTAYPVARSRLHHSHVTILERPLRFL